MERKELEMDHTAFIRAALEEDIASGDHSTLSCIPSDAIGKATLKVKEDCVIAGLQLAEHILKYLDPQASITKFCQDGDEVKMGDIAFDVRARIHALLMGERLLLNCMQRMSGIATSTRRIVKLLEGYSTQLLDTRKTTPLFRYYEKWAVHIGGGVNHRMGLYDMIMLKDNHIDHCGGIKAAIERANAYRKTHNLNIEIEVETRSLEDVKEVLAVGGVDRIMVDNFTPEEAQKAVTLIAGAYKVEASGGINEHNAAAYAQAGVDYISIGALIHHAQSVDLSLKAVTIDS